MGNRWRTRGQDDGRGTVRRHAARPEYSWGEGKPSEAEEWDWDALLGAWVEEGLDESRFLEVTPRAFTNIIAAKQRGERVRIIALAHTIEAIAIDSTTSKGGKKLKPLEHYLRPIERQAKKRRTGSQNVAVAAFLDSLAARQQKKEQSDGG